MEQTIIIDSGNGSTGCEFGYEIIMVTPYVYYLHVKCKSNYIPGNASILLFFT